MSCVCVCACTSHSPSTIPSIRANCNIINDFSAGTWVGVLDRNDKDFLRLTWSSLASSDNEFKQRVILACIFPRDENIFFPFFVWYKPRIAYSANSNSDNTYSSSTALSALEPLLMAPKNKHVSSIVGTCRGSGARCFNISYNSS